jgi:hypothetical protein
MKREPFRHTTNRGLALIITLAAVVLLTALVLAFFSRANLNRQIAFSSSNLIKVDQMARSAEELIIGELRQEIVSADNSNALSGGNTSYSVIYQPKSPKNISPLRSGVVEPDVLGKSTLVKVSSSGTAFAPSTDLAGSPVGIETGSLNGRFFSTSRWFGSGGPGFGSQSTLPSWIFLTRNNGAKTPDLIEAKNASGDDYVVGRFSYTVYDVSGRLDANVAGYPTVVTAEKAGSKASLAYADLSAVDAGFTPVKINSFLTWRNGSDAATADAYETFLNGFGSKYGYTEVKYLHNAFLSRKDLLKAVTDGILPGGASYFTHFSRTLNAPTWGPATNSSTIPGYVGGTGSAEVKYLDNANADESANRLVPNVRQQNDAQIVHYRDDGTIEPAKDGSTNYSYAVVKGDWLLQRRFSLAKVKWIGTSGPNASAFNSSLGAAAQAKAIQDCFGLKWHSNTNTAGQPSNARWEYVAQTGTPKVGIKTLQQAAQEKREPNFFELLKAGILNGSLGRDPGAVCNYDDEADASKKSIEGPAGMYFDSYSADQERHILQIGANIIDQCDSDQYPTAIYLKIFSERSGDSQTIDQIYNTVYGIENLPYIHRLWVVRYEDPKTSNLADVNGQAFKFWLQPELWNPHQATTQTAPAGPSHFRWRAYGQIKIDWYQTNSGTRGTPSLFADLTTVDFDQEDPPSRNVYFKDPNAGGNTSPFYSNPSRLTGARDADSSIGTNESINLYNASDPSMTVSSFYENIDPTTNDYAAIFVASIPYYRDRNNAAPKNGAISAQPWNSYNINSGVWGNPYYGLTLEYWDGNGWRPYTTMSRIHYAIQGNPVVGGSAYPTNTISALYDGSFGMVDRTLIHAPDPRTDRFSVSSQRQNGGWKAELTVMPQVSASGLYSGISVEAAFPQRTSGFVNSPVVHDLKYPIGNAIYAGTWAYNQPNNPTSETAKGNTYYLDPDGVTRPGDGLCWNLASGDGCYWIPAGSGAKSGVRRRPIILDRPFRSVAELGYVFRDLPGKNLDFWTASSGDAALLDLFAVTDQPAIAAGTVNVNAASVPVLKAILSGATTMNAPVTSAGTTSLLSTLSAVNAETVAQAILNRVQDSSKNPLVNRAGLALDLGVGNGDIINNALPASADSVTTATWADRANKASAEAPARALSNVTDMRTWNLLIDVVAQTGRLGIAANSLKDFTVEGEKRYWMHVSIDRYTGKVIYRQLEPAL